MADGKITQYKVGNTLYDNAIDDVENNIVDNAFQDQYSKLKALTKPVKNISINGSTLIIDSYTPSNV